ncbi:flavin-containing monooxygenase/FMO family protein [Ceratobasidium sp. AG-Ba]|nr:flavin-containing monooxygenase/FMO family protein [Ceratobasidium sp. AG-Ba]QRW06718.1 flavin-containing monooxygenase/FMO family protein [Ceratobasidium sp. AG-Ba]
MAEHTSRRFAVIGVGAAGLATLRVISQEIRDQIASGEFELVGFEKRQDLGGVWFSEPSSPPLFKQKWPESAIYKSLTTNIPHPLMYYSSFPAAPSTPLFTPAGNVHDYMHSYAAQFNLRQYIKFNSTVTSASWNQSTGRWEVTSQSSNGTSSDTSKSYFDHLFVANGHYRRPFIPEIAGFSDWAASDSRSYTHSICYRTPEPYKNHSVLVIGGGRSGIDISEEVAGVAKQTVHSIRSRGDEDFEHIIQRGAISHFSSDGFVHFVNGKKELVDRIIFATGYEYDCSFLTQLPIDEPRLSSDHLYNSRFHIYPLALHMFPLKAIFPPSSLALIGIPIGILVFTQVEAEATLAIRQMIGKVSIDFEQEMLEVVERNEQLRRVHNDSPLEVARAWHRFEGDSAWDFVDLIWEKAGESHRTPAWKRELMPLGYVMRAEWERIDAAGLSQAWLDGVGKGGIEEWVDHMRRVLRRARERQYRSMAHLA